MAELKESALQADLVYRVRLLGGLAFKLAPTAKGMPDLLVLLPGGHMYLVELKTDTGQVSPAQHALHARIAEAGTVVHVLRGKGQIQHWLRARYADNDDRRRNRNAPRRRTSA